MAGIIEIGEAVETIVTFAPWLTEIPVLGTLIRSLGGHENDLNAIEKLNEELRKKKTDRETRIKRNGRYVLKASDAMQCVEDHLMSDGAILLALGKALLNTVRGAPSSNVADILTNRIFECIESKVLKQTGKRTKKEGVHYARPAKGHGHGRK